jgi:hypothetical protein
MMSGSAASPQRQRRGAGGRRIEHAFLRVFQSVKKKLKFTSPPLNELPDRMLDALVLAATSKCVDFNILANRIGTHSVPGFLLMSNLRGICEDLIYLTYLVRLGKSKAAELIMLISRDNVVRGILAQRDFFEANNPLQPVLGAGPSADQARLDVQQARASFLTFWKSIGVHKRDGLTVRDIASEVGLLSTYEYIYFAASNFVHFNCRALLRTGWGPQHGPFDFSIFNLDSPDE